jgi:predicted deacylase
VVGFSPTGSAANNLTSVNVSFDQPVDQVSAQTNFSINPPVSGGFSWNGNTLVFKPSSPLPPLVTYTVTILKGVKSIGGEDSVQQFSGSFTTTSERLKTIGYSVKKRAITAYYFGNGPKKILLIGTMHGNEANTGNMLTSWIGYLRANQNQIGLDRTFIIVPFASPDGRATGNRFNANNVDLNRNFDLPDWQSLTYWQNRSYPNGGGSAPFSEPESRALRDLVIAENPSLSISYHSNANLVIGDGIAQAFGDWYSNLTGYIRSQSSGEESDVSAVGYVITGTYEEWATKRGVPTLVIEFISQTANEYSRNLPALKGLLTYPI